MRRKTKTPVFKMLITDKEQLKKYTAEHRIWQGIPGIEVTKKGRIFLTFYSGGVKEQIGNFTVLVKSDDGINYSEPIAAAYNDGHRCYDPCIWIDPLGRLWFTWAYAPDSAVYASICEDPDADTLKFCEPFVIGKEVMMNKPTVLSTGEWLFPIAVWNRGIRAIESKYDSKDAERKSFVYKSIDNGRSFERLGGADVAKRSFDEHMILELNDGTLAMYVRTTYGIGVSYSYDKGKTWTEGVDSGLGGPCSRFFIRRLRSGNVLLINHYNFKGRNNLTAFLSEDDGKTWKHKLLLDERDGVSYPDAVEHEDGYIYITYDRERGAFLNSLDDVYASAREILVAKIKENDIVEGKLVSENGYLKRVASKLGRYADEACNPFNEFDRFSDDALTDYLLTKPSCDIPGALFEHYRINCINLGRLDNARLDTLVEKLQNENADKEKTVSEMISLIRSVSELPNEESPIIERTKNILSENITADVSLKELADTLKISQSYLCYLFKKSTGITVTDYKKELKLSKAKELLINSDKKISEIASICGFMSDSYFSEVFLDSERVTPSQYRRLLKR